jgi:Uma2 family endonuclease
MSIARRYTSADLEALPYVEGTRYEIIDGELHVSTMPRWEHQYACSRIIAALQAWDDQTELGVTLGAPGLVFSPDNDVAPDVIWVSRARLAAALDAGGHLRAAPELVVEVLSPGAKNERRDREQKLALYARQGVEEYWIVNWRQQAVDVYRHEGDGLRLVATLGSQDALTSPLLLGFTCPVASLWTPPL